MKTYKPGHVTNQELQRELHSIVQASYRANPWEALQVLTVEPVRPFVGMYVYADGSSFDPGSGEGVYVYKSDNAWHFLG